MDSVARGETALLDLVPGSLRRLVQPRLRSVRRPRGATIVGLDSRSTEVFFLAEGQAQVLLYSSSGREVSVRNLHPGEFFGELAALDGQPRCASVIAVTDVRLWAMTRGDFLACIDASPAAALWLAQRLGAEVRRLTERVFELSALSVQARLHCELLRLARASGDGRLIVNPAPTHAELASRIGTHREAVTRELRALSEMRIIRAGRRSLEFLDIAGLERVAGRATGEMDELGHT